MENSNISNNESTTPVSTTPVSSTIIEAKVNIRVNEDPEDKDFTFNVPQQCSYDLAKRGALGMYEHIVRVELDAYRKQLEEQVSTTQVSEVPVELVG